MWNRSLRLRISSTQFIWPQSFTTNSRINSKWDAVKNKNRKWMLIARPNMPCHTTTIYSNDFGQDDEINICTKRTWSLLTNNDRTHAACTSICHESFADLLDFVATGYGTHATHAFLSIFILFTSPRLAILWWRWIAYGSNMRWNLIPKYVSLFCFVIMFEITIVSIVRWWNRLIQKLSLTRQALQQDSDSRNKGIAACPVSFNSFVFIACIAPVWSFTVNGDSHKNHKNITQKKGEQLNENGRKAMEWQF